MHTENRHAPRVIAHRAGGGQWPQNSRTAVLNCIARAHVDTPESRYDGMEVDIVLTRDGIPVLSHDPWVHTDLCTTASGAPIKERILIRDKTLVQLRAEFVCGGVPDRDHPRVKPIPESIMSLEEVLAALKKAPEMLLYLDVKIDGELTAGPKDYARAIASRWQAARLPNRLYIEGPSAESLAAYREAMGRDFVPVLSYPAFSAAENAKWTVVKACLLTWIRLRSPLKAAREAAAAAIAAPTWVMTRSAAAQVREAGLEVFLFTPNSRKELDRYCTWPVEGLITDYPGLGHCR
jgi:glycerophosphoryl diester phosphodiesterase